MAMQRPDDKDFSTIFHHPAQCNDVHTGTLVITKVGEAPFSWIRLSNNLYEITNDKQT